MINLKKIVVYIEDWCSPKCDQAIGYVHSISDTNLPTRSHNITHPVSKLFTTM